VCLRASLLIVRRGITTGLLLTLERRPLTLERRRRSGGTSDDSAPFRGVRKTISSGDSVGGIGQRCADSGEAFSVAAATRDRPRGDEPGSGDDGPRRSSLTIGDDGTAPKSSADVRPGGRSQVVSPVAGLW